MQFEYDKYGSAFLDMRLHKLRIQITDQMDFAFETHGIDIPSTCISLVLYLLERPTASIAQLAEGTNYSHQLINQRLTQLEALSFSKRVPDTRDRRRMLITLTPVGIKQARKLENFLTITSDVFDDIFEEIGIDLQAAVTAARAAISTRSILNRINAQPQKPSKHATS